jgi:hypothetical protein
MAGARCGRRRSWSEFVTACGRGEGKEVAIGEDEDEDGVKGQRR